MSGALFGGAVGIVAPKLERWAELERLEELVAGVASNLAEILGGAERTPFAALGIGT